MKAAGSWLVRVNTYTWPLDDGLNVYLRSCLGAVFLVGVGLTIALWIIGGNMAQFLPITFLVSLASIVAYMWLRMGDSKRRVEAVFLTMGPLLVIAATVAVYMTGAMQSVVAILYAVLVFGYILFTTPRFGLYVTVLVCVGYTTLTILTLGQVMEYAPSIQFMVADPTKDPATVWGAWAVVMLGTVASQLIGSYTMMTIHEQRSALERNDALKSKYLGIVSHDLRTPMTSMRAYAEIIRDEDGISPAERGRFAHVIVGETERLTRLVSDLLDLDKIEAGKMEWRFEQGNLAETLEKNLNIFQRLADNEGIQLETVIADGCPEVRFDEDRISQVVTNILSNAIKNTPTGGNVTLRLALSNGDIAVNIEDTGPGIPESKLGTIFERFVQADGEDQKTGTGLGLAIAKEIVEHHGGRIWASNGPDKGAVFSFTIPVFA